MISVRKAAQRGLTQFNWLLSRHTFSFGHYFDPDFVGFRSLRVINDDLVSPGAGFGMHAHQDMEIVTLVLSGALEHRDTLGSGSVITPGMVQRMTAGRGIKHSEFNHSSTEPVHFLQIWVEPQSRGLNPSYQEADLRFLDGAALVASPDGIGAAVKIHQDVRIWVWNVAQEEERLLTLKPGRFAWLHVARGMVGIDSEIAEAGDGIAVSNEEALTVRGLNQSEVVVFDLS